MTETCSESQRGSADGRVDSFPELRRAIPRVCLRKGEAAASLGVSQNFFVKEVLPELRVVRKGTVVMIPVRELERWAEANAELTLGAVA